MDKELYKQIIIAIAPGVVNDYHQVSSENNNVYPITKIGNTVAQIATEIVFQVEHNIKSCEQSLDNEPKDNKDSDIYICRNALDGIVIFKGKPKYNATKKRIYNSIFKRL